MEMERGALKVRRSADFVWTFFGQDFYGLGSLCGWGYFLEQKGVCGEGIVGAAVAAQGTLSLEAGGGG